MQGTHTDPFTVGSIIRYNARHFPQASAFIADGEVRSNGALHDRAARLARAYEDAGLQRTDRVAILSRNTIAFFEVYASGWLGGTTIATVNYRLAVPEMAYILNDSLPRILIFEDIFADTVDVLRTLVPHIETYVCIGEAPSWAIGYEAFLEGASRPFPALAARPDDPAVLIYTSGTTGRPKGCIHTHAGLWHMAQIMARQQHAQLHDTFLLVMPMFHLGGLGCGLAHLSLTGTCVVLREFDADTVIHKIEEHRIGLILLAPVMVQMLLDSPLCADADLSSLHTLMYSASPMPSKTLRLGLKRFGSVFMQYFGQTEIIATYLPKAMHRPDGSPEEQALLLSAGIEQPGIRVKVVDDAGREVPTGEAGEIMASSACSAVGYWRNPEATAQTFSNGWTAMGDVGRMDEQGFLYIVDRKKDVIISGGENIYSREVEEAVLLHAAVAEVAVVGQPDERWGESVCAFVRLRPGETASESEIIAHARQQIASYKKPKRVVFIEDLPRLVSGKIDKKALRASLVDPAPPT